MPTSDLLKDDCYRIISKLGRGNRGVVFLIEDTKENNEKYF